MGNLGSVGGLGGAGGIQPGGVSGQGPAQKGTGVREIANNALANGSQARDVVNSDPAYAEIEGKVQGDPANPTATKTITGNQSTETTRADGYGGVPTPGYSDVPTAPENKTDPYGAIPTNPGKDAPYGEVPQAGTNPATSETAKLAGYGVIPMPTDQENIPPAA